MLCSLGIIIPCGALGAWYEIIRLSQKLQKHDMAWERTGLHKTFWVDYKRQYLLLEANYYQEKQEYFLKLWLVSDGK